MGKTLPSLRYILVPISTFLLLLCLAALADTALPGVSIQLIGQAHTLVDYVAQVGMWLSSAWVLYRLLNFFFWEVSFQAQLAIRSPISSKVLPEASSSVSP
jgi:hypothetical protein